MKTIAEAQLAMLQHCPALPPVRLALLDALGHVLATDVSARRDLPPFDNSAMDGYAVRHADLSPGVELEVAGESRAGGGAPPALPPGQALRIFTGAPLPAGADTVVIQENAERGPAGVRFTSLPDAGAHVRKRGTDMAAGAVALPSGTVLGAGELALLAAQGHASVDVHRPPRVAVLTTGDELRDIGQDLQPGTIVDSNAYALAAQLRQAGALPWVLLPARDSVDEIAERLRAALAADMVLSAGGVSVGEHDHVAEALARVGVETVFHKVAIKPGKPLLFGLSPGSVPVVGLPGNPVSAMVTFEVFVRPCLMRMRGHRAPFPAPQLATLEHDHRHSTGRTELARGCLGERDGRPSVSLLARQGSGSLPSMVGVDALVVLPAERAEFPAGCPLTVLPLGAPPRRSEPPVPDP